MPMFPTTKNIPTVFIMIAYFEEDQLRLVQGFLQSATYPTLFIDPLCAK